MPVCEHVFDRVVHPVALLPVVGPYLVFDKQLGITVEDPASAGAGVPGGAQIGGRSS
jgi:hypothetical protein